MSHNQRIFLVSACLAAAAIGLFLLSIFFGNPISRALVQHRAAEHLRETYTETDYAIASLTYHAKDGNYYVQIASPSSPDSHFFLAYSLSGKLLSDSFPEQVVQRRNTYNRLNGEYEALVREVFAREAFPIETDMAFGRLRQKGEADTDHMELDFGIPTTELKLDGNYDVRELGSRCGSITFYAYDEDVTVERASELMFTVRQALAKSNVPFYALTFHLQKPRNADGSPNADTASIDVIDFLYSDLYAYELESRVGGAARRAAAMADRQTTENHQELSITG